MADPDIQKTWEFEVNGLALQNNAQASTTAHQDRREMMLGIKQRLTNTGSFSTFTTPWTVQSSSDGHTNASAADHWGDIDDLVWRDEDVPGNNFSWIVLRQTGIGATFELLIACESDSVGDDGSQIYAAVSVGGWNTDGNLTTIPTPVTPGDFRVIRNDDGTSQGYWGSGTDAGSPTGGYRWHVMMSSDGECTRVITFANTVNLGVWIFDKPDNPVTGWTDPYVAVIQATNSFSTTQASYTLFNAAAAMKGRFSGADTTMFLSTEGLANTSVGQAITTRNQLDNTWAVSEMGIASQTATFTGHMGQMFDLWWGPATTVSGRYYPQGLTKLYVNVGSMIFPWDGSSLMATK
jgi:hypothetical protein